MRVRICAAGRLRSGPEKELTDRYLERFDKLGRNVGLGPSEVVEFGPSRSARADPLSKLLGGRSPGSVICLLDERGASPTSTEFARMLDRWRSGGAKELTFVIGGPSGLGGRAVSAGTSVSLGRMVYPHKLARVMLAEQLYRAATILGGGPYHRD